MTDCSFTRGQNSVRSGFRFRVINWQVFLLDTLIRSLSFFILLVLFLSAAVPSFDVSAIFVTAPATKASALNRSRPIASSAHPFTRCMDVSNFKARVLAKSRTLINLHTLCAWKLTIFRKVCCLIIDSAAFLNWITAVGYLNIQNSQGSAATELRRGGKF